MAVVRKLKRLVRLKRADRGLLVRAYLTIGAVDLALRGMGFQRFVQRMEREAPSVFSDEDLRRAARYAYWIELASRHHVARARCLHRSLALHWWLRRESLPSELRIGVSKERGALKAHAWVELGGRVVNDHPLAVMPFLPLSKMTGVEAGSNGDAIFNRLSW